MKNTAIVWLMAVLALFSVSTAWGGKTYVWTDVDGTTHMSESPPQDVYNFELGQFFLSRNQLSRAVEHLREAVRLRPDNVEYRLTLAEAYKSMGQLDNAISSYQKAADMQPTNLQKSKTLAEIARIQMMMGDSEKALSQFKQAADYNETDLDILFSLADAQDANGDKQSAIETLRKCILIDPDHVDSLERLGNLLIDTAGDYTSAMRHLAKVVRLDPNRHNAKVRLGTCYFKAGRRDDGIELWQQVVAQDRTNTPARYGLGSYYAGTGQTEQAMEMYHALLPLNSQLAVDLLKLIRKFDPAAGRE